MDVTTNFRKTLGHYELLYNNINMGNYTVLLKEGHSTLSVSSLFKIFSNLNEKLCEMQKLSSFRKTWSFSPQTRTFFQLFLINSEISNFYGIFFLSVWLLREFCRWLLNKNKTHSVTGILKLLFALKY